MAGDGEFGAELGVQGDGWCAWVVLEGDFACDTAVDVDGNVIIGTSGMSFVEKPPYFGCPTGRLGLLSIMYTNPNYRRMGIAKGLLNRVVEEARAYGCGAVHITASDMGGECDMSQYF